MTTLTVKVARFKTFIMRERICELFNMVHFAAWSATMVFDPRILQLFSGFTAPNWVYSLIFIVLTFTSIIGMYSTKACRALAAGCWAPRRPLRWPGPGAVAGRWALGIIFWQSYPPFSPWMIYYPAIAFLTFWFARDIEKEYKQWGRCDV